MKGFLKYIMLGVVVAITACEDEDKIKFQLEDTPKGAVANFTTTANDDGFINLTDLNSVNLEFSVDLRNDLQQGSDGLTQGSGKEDGNLEFAPVNSVDVEVLWTRANGDKYTGLISSLTAWPETITLTIDDLIAAFDDGVIHRDSLALGDQFQITGGFNLEDGRKLPGFVTSVDGTPTLAFSPSFANQPGLVMNLVYLVTCPSNLAGSYTAELVSSNVDASNFRTPQPVTVTGAGGVYQLSDGTLDIFGPDFPIGMAFSEICESITVTPASIDFPAQVIYTQGPGTSYDPDTGVITFDITYAATSCCGLAGIQYTFTITPN